VAEALSQPVGDLENELHVSLERSNRFDQFAVLRAGVFDVQGRPGKTKG
jgi:hypothetical protein